MKNIVVEGLKYRYPGTEKLALNDISFEVEAGEFIGIIGRNLSGKTTLSQALVGLVPHFYHGAYGGRVMVEGLEVREQTIAEMSRKVGIVFQNPFTQVTGSKLTVYEEVAFGLENLGVKREEMIRRVEDALKLMGIEAYRDRNPFDLSGGQMQRMAIASIIAMKPQVIVLDEPTSQLDPQGSEEVFQGVQSLSREGMTVIMTEHKPEKIAQYADKVLLLDGGRVVDFDSPGKVFSREDLLEYGVEPPIYTKVCQKLNLRRKESGLFPVTLEEAREVLQKWR
ncbi:ATP-binding cassette domain-containing protein [Kroppenstedtia pulmonis]|uniref:ATP-binding cassette domain-containing protein n=1 Tax=Kroppenstedtia pulmonis TaxID=1380685 RepID=A0A7D4BV26_9BACL|nr:ATP-binding cassette domain-containing protein [Kroppenstedtia pulmonis]QKG83633.1 ATP-binding cassette domain-containing protein [Kroppenstedtia pulmonis]